MMLKWWKPPKRKSLQPPLPQLRHQGPAAVAPLPKMQAICEKRPIRHPRGTASYQIIHQCPLAEISLGARYRVFTKMIPKQQNPSRRTRPSASAPPRKLGPSAPQPSRKPRPPTPTPSRKLKPFAAWPSGKQRPKELPRLTHFTDHMLFPTSTWKNKLLSRRVRVSSTASLPVKPPFEPALWNSMAHW